MFLLLLFLAQAYEVLKIPSTGPPPVKRIALSTVYDAYTNQLFVFGGYNNILSEFQSTVHTFSLTSYTWGEILPQSLINPNGFSESCSYIRPDRTILFFFGENEFGISSDIYSFSLETYSWKIEVLTGDPILGRTGASCASFEYENEDYMVVFGGLNVNGKNNDLFM